MFRRIRSITVGLVLVISSMLSIAAHAQEPIVYGLFFYSPTCPHCHEVINNHWPGIQQTFGDQLRVLFIDVSGPAGAQIMQETRQAMNIESGGVPMLIIGSKVLIGSIDIPQNAPGVIRTGLASGGIALPPIPVVQDAYEVAIAQYEAQRTQQDTSAAVVRTENIENPSMLQRLQADPVANAAAIFILTLLLCSLGVIMFALTRHDKRLLQANGGRLGRGMLIVLALVGMALTLSLVAGATRDTAVMALAGGELLMFLVLVVALIRTQQMPNWLLPLTAFAGLAVAAYMTYVEVNMTEAVCGTVGNCNLVQQSPYARVLNIPIGVIGVAGFTSMIVIWGVSRMNQEQRWLKWALVGMAFAGTLFSTYLTFVEPFVIGASCAWCLTSAVLTLILLWIMVMSEGRTASPSTALA